jgi:putative protease
MIDLTNIGSGDKTSPDKAILIEQFEQLLQVDESDNDSSNTQLSIQTTLNELVPESTNVQYHNGL